MVTIYIWNRNLVDIEFTALTMFDIEKQPHIFPNVIKLFLAMISSVSTVLYAISCKACN